MHILISLSFRGWSKSFLTSNDEKNEWVHIRQNDMFHVHAWLMSDACTELCCLILACLIIQSKAGVTATICYEVIVLGETRKDWCCTEAARNLSAEEKKKRKIDALSRIKQSPPQPSDTRLQLWGQRSTETLLLCRWRRVSSDAQVRLRRAHAVTHKQAQGDSATTRYHTFNGPSWNVQAGLFPSSRSFITAKAKTKQQDPFYNEIWV